MGENDAKDATAFDRLKKIKSVWGWVVITLAILTEGIAAEIQAAEAPFTNAWQVIWVTLPLTIAVAIIVGMAVLDVLTFTRLCFTIVLTLVASGLTGATAGTSVSHYLLGNQAPGESGFSIPQILGAYLHVYGFVGCIKSVVVGGFIGWASCTLMILARSKGTEAEPGPGESPEAQS